MTRTTNARIAGITSMVLVSRAKSGEGITAKLAGIAQHATDVRVAMPARMQSS